MNVVFDLGAVLLAWEPTRLVQTHLPEHAPTEAAAAALGRALFHHDDWMSFDCGMRSLDEAIARMARRLSLPADRLDAMLGTLGERLEPIAATAELLDGLFARREAGEALRLYYLSNMPAPYAQYLERTHALFDLFEQGVFSSRVKMVKPEPAIFRRALETFGLAARDCVFLDDHEPNVAVARAEGWRAIHFTDAAAARTALGL